MAEVNLIPVVVCLVSSELVCGDFVAVERYKVLKIYNIIKGKLL